MILFSILSISFLSFGQTTYYSRASGNWNSNTTWSASSGGGAVGAGIYPTSIDNVIIERGFTVTINISNAQCASLRVGPIATTNTAGLLTFSGASPSLTVTGAVYVGGYGSNTRDGTITFTNGSTLDAGTITLCGTGGTPGQGTIVMTAGGTMITGGIAIGSAGGTWTRGIGTVVMDANNTLPNTIFTNFNNLRISAGTTTLSIAIPTLSGSLTVNGGAELALSTFNLGATTAPTSIVLECGAPTGSSITGTGTLTLGGNVSVNNMATGTNGASISSPVSLGATRTFNVADDGTSATDLAISGVIAVPLE